MTTENREEISEAPAESAPPVPPEAIARPHPNRRRLLILAAVVAALFLTRPTLRMLAPAPSLSAALKLAAQGKTAEAEAALSACIAYSPHSAPARVALAELLLETPASETKPGAPAANPVPIANERAERVLKILEDIRPEGPRQYASVRVLQGKAHQALHYPGRAEKAWSEALRLDPQVGEAGWLLLQLYYLEGRIDETRRLALRLARVEPEPRDKVRLILEPSRSEAEPLAAAGIVAEFKEAVALEPDDLPSSLAYYRALARDGTDVEKAIAGLRGLVAKHPDNLGCWDGLIGALVEVDLDATEEAFTRLPAKFANEPKLLRHRGQMYVGRKQFDRGIEALKAAIAVMPSDLVTIHRLADALKLAGRTDEADAARKQEADLKAALLELQGTMRQTKGEGVEGLFAKLANQPNLGLVPDFDSYKKMADVRERMGHPDEARAWHGLVLSEVPDDAESLAAVARLDKILEKK